MKRNRIVCILLIMITLTLTACGTGDKEGSGMKKYSILFIGNSYTFYHDMPEVLFKELAESAGYEVEIDSITSGGYKLHQHADPNDEVGAKVEKALSGKKKYDYVILQEQSIRPATNNVTDFYSSVRDLAKRIRKAGAEPILYATWGRKSGSPTLAENGWTNESMTWKLAAAYQAIGDELDIKVAHVGMAFYEITTGQSGIELYDPDLSHPSREGSGLAAAVLYAKIFGQDPTKASFNNKVAVIDELYILEAAKKAVFETPEIPEEYKTSSRGIG